MRIFKNKEFDRWAAREGIDDEALWVAAEEMNDGLIDANLGGNVVKKRIILAGRGKRGGARTLVAYKAGNKAFFIYGFAKSVRANIKNNELKALKLYAAILFGYNDKELNKAVKAGALIEIKVARDE